MALSRPISPAAVDSNDPAGVCAVIVCYYPDFEQLLRLLTTLAPQVAHIVLVNNGPLLRTLPDTVSTAVSIIDSGANIGVAAAFNRGIARAREAGAGYVLLLDQDSLPAEDMVSVLQTAEMRLRQQGVPVAAVGPRCRDSRTHQIAGFVQYKWFRNAYVHGSDRWPVVKTDFLISSGSFYPIGIFDKVGLFDEGLFIDHVDTEWCHRAASLGYACYGVHHALMQHTLGEGGVRFWLLRWYRQPLHKPFRLYYIARNSLLLYQRPYVSYQWICADSIRLLRLAGMYALFSSQRTEALGWFCKGLWDGFRHVCGGRAVADNRPTHF